MSQSICKNVLNALRGLAVSLTSSETDMNLEAINQASLLLVQPEMRQIFAGSDLLIWDALSELWKILSTTDCASSEEQTHVEEVILCIARFTRNVVAGEKRNQSRVFANEPNIRHLLHKYTAFSQSQEPNSIPIARMLIQCLSNLVTSNENLISRLWETYMNLPDELNILIRTLALQDNRAVSSALVLILNCVVGDRQRLETLTRTPTGIRTCITLLDRISSLIDCDEESEDGKTFEIAFRIFEQILDANLGSTLLDILKIDGESTTPHQVTFLKVLDSYALQDRSKAFQCVDMLSSTTALFFDLSCHAQASIRRIAGPSNEESDTTGNAPIQEIDLILPKVCEAIILVAQFFCTVTLAEEESQNIPLTLSPKKILIEAVGASDQGLIEDLIGLLRSLDKFIPRIALGRVIGGDGRLSTDSPDLSGFNYLKRDLVRLLGILCFDSRSVQNRVRTCDGIPIAMNLCVLDERNPYLREHALFTLRNILHGNLENQAVVDAIKPMGAWDDNGALRDSVGTRK